MNRSQTNNAHAHTVRLDAFVAQMHASERAQLAETLERQNVAELERSAIARRIQQARKETGLSQPEMAEALGVIQRTYQNYESVKKPRIPWGSMNDIAKITGKTTEWLIHGDGRQPAPDPFPSSLEERLDRIETFLQQASDERAQMAELLQAQETILQKLTAVADGLPDNQLVRDLSDAARRLQEGAQAGEATRTGRSSGPAASNRRRATDQ